MSSIEEQAFSYIDSNIEEYKKLWIDIASIESPSKYKQGVDKVAETLLQFGAKQQISGHPIPFKNHGNSLYLEYNGEASEQPIVLMGHMDTVHDIGIFKEPVVTEKDGYLYGPGVYDCKGGLIVALLTVVALKSVGYKSRPIKIFFSGDEEIGHEDNAQSIVDTAKGAVAVFNCESAPDDWKIAAGRKSAYSMKLHIKGVGAHSGNDPEKGRSAILEAAHKIIDIEKLNDIQGKGNVVSCSLIQGGTVVNAIPEWCTVTVMIRYKSKALVLDTLDEIRKIAAKSYIPDTHTTIEESGNVREAMEMNEKNMWVFQHYKEASDALGYENVTPYMAGGASDSIPVSAAGIPVLCQTGVRGDSHHTVRERAQISSLSERAKVLVKTILDFR